MRNLLAISFLIHILLWVLMFVRIGFGENTVVLRYNVYFGTELIGSAWQIFFLPSVSLVFLGISTTLGILFFYRGETFTSLLVLASSLFVQVATAIAIVALVIIN